jgi:adenylate cyclase
VLPFSHGAGAAEDEYLMDGLTDPLTTELSRFRALFVISRNSAFIYKHRTADERTVVRELGVRCVLEGSAHRAARSIRVAARLIDAVTGHHIWAERYDRKLADVFVLQDELAHAIVTAMAPYIKTSGLGRARCARLENVTAYELALQAWARGREGLSRSNQTACDEAIRLAERALVLDPRCGVAWNAIVDAHT